MASEVALRNPFSSGAQLNENKLRVYEKSFKQLKSQIIAEDQDIFAKETEKLQQYLDHLKQIRQKTDVNVTDCISRINHLQKEKHDYELKIDQYEKDYQASNKEDSFAREIASEESKFIAICKKRVDIANSIDYKVLSKIDIDERKSEANEVFKWIMVAIYQQPQIKYYWPNFLEQALEEDKGLDLKERLGKVNAFNAKQDQKLKTVFFIDHFEKINGSSEFKKCQSEIQKIYQIAKLFLTSAEIGKKVRELQKEIEKSKALYSKGDEQNAQNNKTLIAIKDRLRVSELYLNQLKQIQEGVGRKLKLYEQKIEEAQGYMKFLVSTAQLPVSSFKAEEFEKRDTCECTIF